MINMGETNACNMSTVKSKSVGGALDGAKPGTMKIVSLPIDSIRPYEKNAKLHEGPSVQIIENSIKDFDFRDPIQVDKNGVIIAGHGRWKAAKDLGMKEVDCIIHSDMTAKQVRAYRLAHNKSSEIEGYDFEMLDEELAALKKDFDLESLGFTFEEPDFSADEDVSDTNDEDDEGGYEDGDVVQMGTPSDRYTLIVNCTDADSQLALFNSLKDAGYEVVMR